MSLATTIGAGALVGGLAAFALYAATAPSDEGAVALPVVPTFAPVPTPTVTRTAPDCEPPAVETHGTCVVTRPGPTVTATAPATGSATPRSRAMPLADGDDDHEDDGADHDDDDRSEDDD